MTRMTDFIARLSMPPAIPSRITGARIDLSFTEDSQARGSPGQMARGLEWTVPDLAQLFAAGFAAGVPGEGAGIALTLTPTASGLSLRVEGAAHRPMMLYCLLKLLEVAAQTPAGAYERLLDLMEGDEAAAREAFSPLFVTDLARVEVGVTGDGAPLPYDHGTPPLLPGLAPLAARIGPETDRMVFVLPVEGRLPGPVDHGFLVLQNGGVFQPPASEAVITNEPEVFLSGQAEVTVIKWRDAGFGLAELLWLIAGGRTGGIALTDES